MSYEIAERDLMRRRELNSISKVSDIVEHNIMPTKASCGWFVSKFHTAYLVINLIVQGRVMVKKWQRRGLVNTAYFMRSFMRHTNGSVAIIFALSAVVFMGASGIAIDYGRAYSTKSSLQAALDSAVMAGVTAKPDPLAFSGVAGGLSDAERLTRAEQHFQTNKPTSADISNVTFAFDSDKLIGNVSAQVGTTLSALLGFDMIDVSTRSGATTAPSYEPLCFMAMHPTRKHTLELMDAVSIIAPKCHIYGNSSHFDDVVDPHTPDNHMVAKSVQAVGYGHHYIQNVLPPLEHAPAVLSDPLASMTLPTAGACTYTNKVVTGGTVTLQPGNYCGGLSITGTAEVTLNPGLYVISGGLFQVLNSTVSGSDVTVALADSLTTLEWRNSTVRLSAQTVGPYASMAMVGVREPTNHVFDSSVIDLHGVVYLVDGVFDWLNTGAATINAKWTAWIIDGVTWRGTGAIKINFDIRGSSIPYPQELRIVPRPGSPRVVL